MYLPGDLLRCRESIEHDGTRLEAGVIVFVVAAADGGRELTVEYESTDVGVPRTISNLGAALFEPYLLGPRS